MDGERWVSYWANKYRWIRSSYIDEDDIKQAVRMGIWRAQKGYDPSKGSWAWYSSYFIRHEIKALIGRPEPFVESLDAPVSFDTDTTLHELVADDSIPENDAEIILDEKRQRVRDAVDQLPEQERDLVKLRYFEDMTQAETAAEMEIPVERVSRIFEKARRRLRRELRDLSYHHIGVRAYMRTRISAVEWAVLKMEQQWERSHSGRAELGRSN